MADTPRRCPAITRGGQPCRIAPQEGFTYCVWHDPERQQEAAEKRRQGGYNSSREARTKKLIAAGLDTLGDFGDLIGIAVWDVYKKRLDPGILTAMATGVRARKDLAIAAEFGEQVAELRQQVVRLREQLDQQRRGHDRTA